MKIANKISLSFVLIAITLTIVAVPIFYTIAKSNLQNAIFEHLKTAVQSRAGHIETFLKMQKDALTQFSQSVVLEDLLRANKSDTDYKDKFDAGILRLEKTKKASEAVYEIFVLDTDARIIVSSNRDHIGQDKSRDAYFLGGKTEPYIKDAYYSKTTKREAIAVSAPILDNKTEDLLGVVVAEIGLDTLNKIIIDRTGFGETGKIYLVNKKGYMITPSRFIKDTFFKLKVDTEHTRRYFEDVKKFGIKPHAQEPIICTDYRGIKVLGMRHYIPQMQWCLLAEIDEEEALAPLARIKHLAAIIMFLAPLMAWLIGIIVSRIISGPIYKLHKGIEIISEGNLDYKTDIKTKDEIGQFSRAFDKMTEDLKGTTVSKSYLDSIIGSMGDALIVITAEGKIKTVNKATCELLGYKEEELMEKDVSLLFPEEEPLKGTKLERLIKDGWLRNYEINYRTKDGRKIPVLLSGAVLKRIDCPHREPIKDCPVYKEKGKHCEKILGVICVAKDITERKQAEEMLRESEERFRALTESTSDWIWEVDENAIYTYANPRVKEILGYEQEEVIGKTPFDLMPPEETKRVAAEFAGIAEARRSFARLENINLHKDGRLVVLETSGVPIFDAEGNFRGYRGIDRDITERKRAEERIRLFSEAVAGAIDAIMITDMKGIITYANPAMEKLYGYDKRELVGKSPTFLNPNPEVAKQIMSTMMKTGSWSGEIVQQEKNKETFPTLLSLSTVRDEKGNPIAMMGAVRDITETKNLISDLETAKAYTDSIIASAADSIFILDMDGTVRSINPAGEKLVEELGIKLDELIDSNVTRVAEKITGPKEIENIVEVLRKAVAGETAVVEIEVSTKDKKKLSLNFSLALIKDTAGDPIGMIGIGRDITERKKKEREIEYLKEYNENIVATIPTAIITCNKELKINTTNETWCKIFKRRKSDIMGAHLTEILGPEAIKNEKLDKKILEVFKTEEPSQELEIRYDFPKIGNKVLSLKIVGITREEEVLLLINDITEKKELQERIKQVDKLASVGQMAAGLTHEINNPLQIIISNIQYLLEQTRKLSVDKIQNRDIADCNRIFQLIEVESKKCAEIIRRLQQFSQKVRPRMGKVDINKKIGRLMLFTRSILSKRNIRVSRRLASNLPKIRGDKTQLGGVFTNLVLNAKEAMPEGGSLTITTSYHPEKKRVTIKFIDTGKGVSGEDMDKIFDPFFTTKKERGVGLGLSVSYGIIKAHKGFIVAERNAKRGMRFTIELPIFK